MIYKNIKKMKKYGGQQNIPKDFFPGDSEEFKIEGPSD